MMHALNDLALQVTTGITKMGVAQQCFLAYCVTNSDVSIVFYGSDRVIRVDNNAVYLVASKSSTYEIKSRRK